MAKPDHFLGKTKFSHWEILINVEVVYMACRSPPGT
jgi:hypothetical protein